MSHIVVDGNLDEGALVSVEQDGQHILVCRVGGEHYALSDICSHARVLLSKGKLRQHIITCPLHGARFDVRTGECLSGPATEGVDSYPVETRGDSLIVSVT